MCIQPVGQVPPDAFDDLILIQRPYSCLLEGIQSGKKKLSDVNKQLIIQKVINDHIIALGELVYPGKPSLLLMNIRQSHENGGAIYAFRQDY